MPGKKMIIYEIKGKPIAWKRARMAGKRFFDPQIKEKNAIRMLILNALEDDMPYTKGLKITVEYQMSVPKSWSSKRRLNALDRPHLYTPDLSNLIKFLEDTLNEIVWKDDKIIYEIHARKVYADEEKTRFMIQGYNEQKLWRLVPD